MLNLLVFISIVDGSPDHLLPPPKPTLPSEKSGMEENSDLYVFLPLVVVILFTLIMLGLILIGRKATGTRDGVDSQGLMRAGMDWVDSWNSVQWLIWKH